MRSASPNRHLECVVFGVLPLPSCPCITNRPDAIAQVALAATVSYVVDPEHGCCLKHTNYATDPGCTQRLVGLHWADRRYLRLVGSHPSHCDVRTPSTTRTPPPVSACVSVWVVPGNGDLLACNGQRPSCLRPQPTCLESTYVAARLCADLSAAAPA
jgi:hypothetical protein